RRCLWPSCLPGRASKAIVSSRTSYSQDRTGELWTGGSALEVADHVLGGGTRLGDGGGVGGGARGGRERGDPRQALPADVEDDRVPAGGRDLGGVLGQAAAAEERPGVRRGAGHRGGGLPPLPPPRA